LRAAACFSAVLALPLSRPNLAARAPHAAPVQAPCRTRVSLIFALLSASTMSSLLLRYLSFAVLTVTCFSAQISVYNDASCLQRTNAFSVFTDVCTALSTQPVALLKCSSDAVAVSIGAPLPGNQTVPLACNDMSSTAISVSTACTNLGNQWWRLSETTCYSNASAFVVAPFRDSACMMPFLPNFSIWDTLVLSSCRDERTLFLDSVSAYSATRGSSNYTQVIKFNELDCSDPGSAPFDLPSSGECSPNAGSSILPFARQFPASPFDPSLALTTLTDYDLLLRASAGASFAKLQNSTT